MAFKEVGYCRGCAKVFPFGPLARANMVKGIPGWCATTGQQAVVVIFPTEYRQR